MRTKILVVDDEPDVIDLVRYNLTEAGYDVDVASDGAEALNKVRASAPALILLDLMLPHLDGLEVCKLLRRDPKTAGIPIIMLTAKTSEIDRVVGLEIGADDYVTKPFSPRELVLRVKKRLQPTTSSQAGTDVLTAGDLQVDVARHLVKVKSKRIELTATEFGLLAELMNKRGNVLSRDQLLREVWEYDSTIDTRTVDTHMRRLREKLGSAAKYLDTIRGVGYRFLEDNT